jgi:uracil-DNA glycosylase family 4
LPSLDPATRDAFEARLRFYRELGINDFYRRVVDSSQTIIVATEKDSFDSLQEKTPIPPRKPMQAAPPIAPEVTPVDRASALQLIREEIGDCTRCALHKGRNKIVFADGDPNARLMFVGEGPGADEDAQGLPFVGRAGQLLNNMIAAMGLKREEVYIANIVKCRPPQNRTPEPDEANTCSPFLFRQIDVVRPEVIVALGATAATYLLGQRQPLAGLRGRIHSFRGSKLIVTYHPAFLLRDPRQKKEAWADLQIAMRELGLKARSPQG